MLASTEPLSFWGGYDAVTGQILDRRHPLSGRIAARSILAVPFTKGSSTTSAVLLEAVRARTSPLAILTRGEDAFLALAAFVAEELYGRSVPLLSLDEEDFALLECGQHASIRTTGEIALTRHFPDGAQKR